MSANILTIAKTQGRCKRVVSHLRSAYFDTQFASSEAEIRAALGQRDLDVILFDWDGDEDAGGHLAELCRQSRPSGDIPLIAATTQAAKVLKRKILDAGFDDFVSPNAPAKELCDRIRALARLRAMGEELAFRCATSRDFGLAIDPEVEEDSRVTKRDALIVGLNASDALEEVCRLIGLRPIFEPDPEMALAHDRGDAEAVIIAQCGVCPERAASLAEVLAVRGTGKRRAVLTIIDGLADSNAFNLTSGAWIERDASPFAAALRLRGQLKRARLTRRLNAMFEEGLRLSARDELTGVFARRYLDTHLRRRFVAAKSAGSSMSVLMVDADRFKEINDRFGHNAGDIALQTIATRLCAAVRGGDLVGRIGGEEFLVVMPEATAAKAHAAGERICSAIAAEPVVFPDGRSALLTVSIGAAEIDEDIATAADLLRRSDAALYEAKRAGRNRVVTAPFEPAPVELLGSLPTNAGSRLFV